MRPIGICDTARRIISKAVLLITRADLQEAVGPLQLCAGQTAGTEAAILALRASFQQEETEAVLLVDATNAFNALNCESALHNIRYLCPALATILINIYRDSSDLYVDGHTLLSEEGTTQGDPLAMPMYALATIPLIKYLSSTSSTVQVWYADDAAASGSLTSLRVWWDNLTSARPAFGYFGNAKKTWLVMKDTHLKNATNIFQDMLTSDGRAYLGSAIGSDEFTNSFVIEKVQQWKKELTQLVDVARVQPHVAFAAYTHGYVHKFSYLCRTTPNIELLLQPLEEYIRFHFIAVLTGRTPSNDTDRELFSLPLRLGGLGITNPTLLLTHKYL